MRVGVLHKVNTFIPYRLLSFNCRKKPKASEVLTAHLRQRNFPHWTSFFVKKSSICNDQFGKSHFNWTVDNVNYHVLRTGCWPYLKYHCTKRNYENLQTENIFYGFLKILNFGIPCLAYGISAWFLVSFEETVKTRKGDVEVFFWYEEDRNSKY